MAEENRTVLTQSGKENAQNRLDFLIGTRRNEIAQQIETARSYGDLSENAEYDEAKKEQAKVEEEISHLQHLLRTAVIISDDEISADVVSVGVKVTVLDLEENIEDTYAIVGTDEADPMNGKISNESEVGKALLGHRQGDEVEVEVPSGDVIRYQVIKIDSPAGVRAAKPAVRKAASKDTVKIGVVIELTENETGEVFTYIMRAKKVDKSNIISPTTKVGKALKDQAVGDVIDGTVFARKHDCRITAIRKDKG